MNAQISLVKQPIFLVGAERSGTTILRLMLSHHPQIAWCYEFEYVVDQMSDEGNFPNLREYYEWLETHRIFQATGFKIDPNLDYPHLVNSFLVQQRDRTAKPIIGATVHRHFDRLLKIWPDARFIHIIRDGRDVSRSCIGMGWAGNAWTGVERWLEVENLWEKLQQTLPPERYLDVVYEDLIKQPEQSLTRLCPLLGVAYSPLMLSYAETTTYDLPNPNLLQQWRRKLSQQEIQLVESRIGEMLKQRGYELSGLPIKSVTPLEKRQLRLQDWWERLQFRFKRYGFSLTLAETISRRLGLKQWNKQTNLKINEIVKAYLK